MGNQKSGLKMWASDGVIIFSKGVRGIKWNGNS